MKYFCRLSLLCFLTLLFCSVTSYSQELKPIKLQLKWRHQFQFAGYYAAQIKGFYKENGLEVDIIEGSVEKPPLKQVIEGKADFGITGSDILYEYINGKPVVVTSVIFQHSPYVLMTLKNSNLRTASDLSNKTIMASDDQGWLLLAALFYREGIDIKKLKVVNHTWNNQDLINGKADAITAYSTVEPEQVRKLGAEPYLIKPSDYGLDFYGDLIFTTNEFAHKNPQTVEAFNEASVKGWEYALSHKEEIINYILTLDGVKLRGIDKQNLIYEANETDRLVLSEIVEVGHINPGRFQQMLTVYKELKLVPQKTNIDGLIYKPTKYNWTFISEIAGLIVGVILLVFAAIIFWNWKLRKSVFNKTKELLNEIEQRKIAESQATDSKEQIELILKSANIGLWDWDLRNNQKTFSEQWYTILGINPNDLAIDFDPFNAIHPDDLIKAREIFQQNLTGTRKRDLIQFRIKNAQGEYIHVLSSSRVTTEDGKTVKISGIVIDIENIKKKEIELLKISEELMQSNNELKKFAYITSHNLRGPVVNISSLFQMIDQETIDGENKIYLEKIGISVDKLEKTLNDLIEIVSHQKPENKSFTTVDFKQELGEIIQSIEMQILASGAKFNTNFEVKSFSYSKKYFESILINLITNAIKYKSVDKPLIININTFSTATHTILKVSDNGIGIDLEKNKSKIFGLYQRFEPKIQGKGIGLFIIKSHIESLGGKIEVESTPNVGTTFTVFFSKNFNAD